MRMRLSLAVLLLAVAACNKKPKPDIPPYPDAMGMQGKGTMQSATMMLFNNRWVTSASLPEVRGFYDKALLTRPGWKVETDLGDRLTYTDGNMKRMRDLYSSIDESKPGGYVEILIGNDRTVIDIWQALPITGASPK